MMYILTVLRTNKKDQPSNIEAIKVEETIKYLRVTITNKRNYYKELNSIEGKKTGKYHLLSNRKK